MSEKNTLNKVRLRNLKRAKIKQLECEKSIKIKQDADKETISKIDSEISHLQKEIKILSK